MTRFYTVKIKYLEYQNTIKMPPPACWDPWGFVGGPTFPLSLSKKTLIFTFTSLNSLAYHATLDKISRDRDFGISALSILDRN
jgi:hypothetical protein